MTLIRTIEETFAAEGAPAVPIHELSARVRALGSACTPDAIRREVHAAAAGRLRALEGDDPVLATIATACTRPAGLDAVVVDAGERGLRATPEDGVRVLARRLTSRDRRARARWAGLLQGLEADAPRP